MIVVTGGAGFIGSNIVHGLNGHGHDKVIVVDDLGDSRKHLNLSGARFTDFFDKDDFLTQIGRIENIEAVLHQGACAVTTEQDGRYMMKTNFSYSKALLQECLKRKIPFIYASSAAVYGLGTRAFSETFDNEKPLNVYGFSKLAFDNHVRSILPGASSPVIGLRYFNVYGPREDHKGDMASVIFKMFRQHQRGEPLALFEGSEGFLRDFVYVKDVVDVNLHFLNNQASGIFNCGTGVTNSFQKLGESVIQNLAGATIKRIEMPAHLARQYQRYTCSDISRLRSAGYAKAFTALDEGIRDYISFLATESK
jgi:ADP-L-glycero-D-manno-heptose 6-epimerase